MSHTGTDEKALLTTEDTVHVKVGRILPLPPTSLLTFPSSPPQFVLSGERDRLKKLAKEKLEQEGWSDELRRQCRGQFCFCFRPFVYVAPRPHHRHTHNTHIQNTLHGVVLTPSPMKHW